MAYTDHTVDVTITDGDITLTIGQETYPGSVTDIGARVIGENKPIDYLWQQIAVRLSELGTNLSDAGSVKAAIESGTYKW